MSDKTPADDPQSSAQAENSSSRVRIVVQPPVTVEAEEMLVPPLVARTDSPRILKHFQDNSMEFFATLMLTASNGERATASNLVGNFHVSGQLVEAQTPGSQNKTGGGSSSSSSQAPHQWICFIFTGLSIKQAGVYTFTVSLTEMNPKTRHVETLCNKASREFKVVKEQQPPGTPSTEEQAILDELQKKNLYNP